MISIKEVFKKDEKTPAKNSAGALYLKANKKINTREILINPDYIVRVVPHEYTSSVDIEMLKEAGLADDQFCRIILDGNNFVNSEIIVASSFCDIEKVLK